MLRLLASGGYDHLFGLRKQQLEPCLLMSVIAWRCYVEETQKGQLEGLTPRIDSTVRRLDTPPCFPISLIRKRRRINQINLPTPGRIIPRCVLFTKPRQEVVIRSLWLDATQMGQRPDEVLSELRPGESLQNSFPFRLIDRDDIALCLRQKIPWFQRGGGGRKRRRTFVQIVSWQARDRPPLRKSPHSCRLLLAVCTSQCLDWCAAQWRPKRAGVGARPIRRCWCGV